MRLFAQRKDDQSAMKKIDIRYNPFMQETAIAVDGEKMTATEDRFPSCIFRKPMDSWLPARTDSYKRWDGFLPELMEYLNEDVLEICFEGTVEDYQCFLAELPQQHRRVEDKGFDASQYKLTGKTWDISQTWDMLRKCTALWKKPLTSEAVHLMNVLSCQLSDTQSISCAQLEECRIMALKIAEICIDRCAKEESAIYRNEKILEQKHQWEKAVRDVTKIFMNFYIQKQ